MKTNYLNMWLFFICLLVFATACEDKSFSPPSSNRNRVKFSLETISEKNASSRSFSDGDSLLSSGIIPLEAEERTLYLHTSVTEGIDGSRLGKDESVTRATPVNDMNDYGSFSVFAAFYQGAWSPDSQNMNFMYHVPVSLSGGVWSPQADYYWPGSGYKVRFFAYAPTDAEFEASNQSVAANDFHIKYDVPTDVSEQKDLLVAKSTEYPGNHGNSVSLQFKHVLTAVRFIVGDDMKAGTVNRISLRNIASAGMYDPETGIGQVSGTVKDFGQELNKVTDGTPDSAITEPFQTFMLPPQSFTEDSSVIEVVFTDNEGEHTLTASLKGQTWMSGTTVTYTISTSSINWDYTLIVEPPAAFDYNGGTKPYYVTSYRQNSKGVTEPVRWTVQFSMDDGISWETNPPGWLSSFNISGPGGTTPQSCEAIVSPQSGSDETNIHTTALRKAPDKGSTSSPYNLANQTNGGPAIENTANCYVVDAPGHYSFPLVYGNAIKNGGYNTSAYSSKVSGSDILNIFINHTGKGITDPYISKNADCVPAKAELVWQDAPGLVTNIRYNNTADGNISFSVGRDYICQGNAVIAIKDAVGRILWSWHIWITDEDLNKTVEITNNARLIYDLMPVNLGWCYGNTVTYNGRSCKVKFIAGKVSSTKTITQSASLVTISGNHTYYQWGRKDPFIPSDGPGGHINKTWYNKKGVASKENPETANFSTGINCIKNYILNPDVMHSQEGGDNTYQNLWSINNTSYASNDNRVVKTIYDPSPVGFTVPISNTFTGFTTTGGYEGDPDINGIWDKSICGWYFYTNPSKTEKTFFQASGYRFCRNANPGLAGSGYYWTADPFDQMNGYYLGFRYIYVHPVHNVYRAYALSLRPIREQKEWH